MNQIRNFALVAHIDHGKSTLADRIMELSGAVGKDHPDQLLDSLKLEREHGITIKLKAVRLVYRPRPTVYRNQKAADSSQLAVDGSEYILNLIDTPGHVDFSYEVSRSLASVEGAVLVVDAAQGVQAQTLANLNLALEANLVIIPVINKIDLPQAEVEKTQAELCQLGFSKEEIIKVSAKTGENVESLLETIIKRIPPPRVFNQDQFAGLIFDSSLDPYKGVVATVRSFSGRLSVEDEVTFLATGGKAQVLQIGFLTPQPVFTNSLETGGIGFVVTNLKDLAKVRVGDTISQTHNPCSPVSGYKQAKPVVFLSFYPVNPTDFPKLKSALERLKLNDAALSFSQESSASLGQGARVGFLGLLHAQITQERLEDEHGLDVITTSPSVNFLVDGKLINKPADFTPQAKETKEPYAKVTIFSPQKYLGAITNFIYEKRGVREGLENIGDALKIKAKMPLMEILIGFYDQLKSATSGFASFDFEVSDYQPAKLVRVDILVNHQPIEALAQIIHTEKAGSFARKLVEKLKQVIPRQQISIPIQAVIGLPAVAEATGGGRIIARETIPALRKDVTAKLYGGDVTRKIKLLEKQKRGKKRMRKFGNVEIPQEAFLAVLEI